MKDIKHIRRDFKSVVLGHAPGVGFGALGARFGVTRGLNKNSNMIMWDIKSIDGDDKQNIMQVKFSSYGHTCHLG